MVFGHPDRFAVEAELLEVYGKWTYGRLRFWLEGVAIGDFEDTSDLATSARWGRTFLAASPSRTRAELDGVTAHEVYELLYGRFVQPVHTLSPKPWAGSWDRAPHVLDEVGESALRDDFAIVVVRRGDGTDRLLLRCFEDGRLSETSIPRGECDRVIESYCDWVEHLRAAPPPGESVPCRASPAIPHVAPGATTLGGEGDQGTTMLFVDRDLVLAFTASTDASFGVLSETLRRTWPEATYSRSERRSDAQLTRTLSALRDPAGDAIEVQWELYARESRVWCGATVFCGQATMMHVESACWGSSAPTAAEITETVTDFLALVSPRIARLAILAETAPEEP